MAQSVDDNFESEFAAALPAILALALKLPAMDDAEFDLVTAHGRYIADYLMPGRRLHTQEKMIEIAMHKEMRAALRKVGIANYLTFESLYPDLPDAA